jgi:tetratricopeptide (TPR) repeat protein
MTLSREQLSLAGRQAVRSRQWPEALACARALLRASAEDAEGHFLLGVAEKGRQRPDAAIKALRSAIALDCSRYDAAVEMAGLTQRLGRHGEAVGILRAREAELDGSPYYLDAAATIYAQAGLPDAAWRLYRKADERQPGLDAVRARLAAASVHVGRTEEARAIYEALLARNPRHQRNHYELSRLAPATDDSHIRRMRAVLDETRLPPAGNIYLYFALGKEYEDLGLWDEAFCWYEKGGDAAASVAGYDVREDIALIDALIDIATPGWLAGSRGPAPARRPLFVVGLPRSGTTLIDRILSSHSLIESAGESFFVPAALRQLAGGAGALDADLVTRAAGASGGELSKAYLAAIDYRLGSSEVFIDKLPENVLYLGFLARAFPGAHFIHVRRNPMDACFALYKQSFFRYAYTQDDLGRYYPAYRRLARHWEEVLGERVIDVDYDALVVEPETTLRRVFARLGLAFEPACLDFHRNPAPTNTASAVQVREPLHARSVGRWRHFARQLEPLARMLRAAGIETER